MGIIYCITNQINKKQYIGQTSRILEKRWHEHIIAGTTPGHSKSHRALYSAISKYGIENFKIEVLENCDNDKLNQQEMYWINIKNTMVPNGYNLTPGGDCSRILSNMKQVSCYDLQGNKIETFPSIVEASKKYGASESIISFCCQEKPGYITSEGMYWKYGNVEKIEIINIPSGSASKKKIFCYDKNTLHLIAQYNCSQEAANAIGKKNGASNIRAACRGKHAYIYGYIWSEYEWEIAPTNYLQLNQQKYKKE